MKTDISCLVKSIKLSRWRLLGMAIGVALTLALALGCGQAEPTATPIPTQAPATAAATATPLPLPTKTQAPSPTTEPPAPTAEQIVADAVSATAAVDTYKFDMDMLMTMEMSGGDQPAKVAMESDTSGTVDNANKEMQMAMNMNVDIPDQGKQKLAMEFYVVGGWMYTKIGIPGVGEQWIKTKLTEEMWQAQNQIGQQIELLKTATAVNLLGSEDVNGTASYVIEIVPSMEALGKLLSQQQLPGTEDIDLGQLNLAGLFKEMLIKQWITKDGHLLVKSEVHLLMEMSSDDVGATKEDFEKMTIDMNIEMKIYDYDQAASIELPEGALEAPEMPGG